MKTFTLTSDALLERLNDPNLVQRTEDGCWLWKDKSVTNNGRPRKTIDGKQQSVQVWIYEAIKKSPIPSKEILTSCNNNTTCINPDHFTFPLAEGIQKHREKIRKVKEQGDESEESYSKRKEQERQDKKELAWKVKYTNAEDYLLQTDSKEDLLQRRRIYTMACNIHGWNENSYEEWLILEAKNTKRGLRFTERRAYAKRNYELNKEKLSLARKEAVKKLKIEWMQDNIERIKLGQEPELNFSLYRAVRRKVTRS